MYDSIGDLLKRNGSVQQFTITNAGFIPVAGPAPKRVRIGFFVNGNIAVEVFPNVNITPGNGMVQFPNWLSCVLRIEDIGSLISGGWFAKTSTVPSAVLTVLDVVQD